MAPEDTTIMMSTWSTTGSVLATAGGDNVVRIWRVDVNELSMLKCAILDGDMATIDAIMNEFPGVVRSVGVLCQESAVFSACRMGDMFILQRLVDAGAHVSTVNSFQDTPLHSAMIQSNAEIARYLLEHGANVDAVNERNETALHVACRLNNLEMCAVLLEAGAGRDVQDCDGNTPLLISILYSSFDVIFHLLLHGKLMMSLLYSKKNLHRN